MSIELIIAIALISCLFGVFVVKFWLLKLFKLKMDEGHIEHFLRESNNECESTMAIAAATNLESARVEQICKARPTIKAITTSKENTRESNTWALTSR